MNMTATEVRLRQELYAPILAERARKVEERINAFILAPMLKHLTWEYMEKPKWVGRDWRRLKREKRKFFK